MRKFLIQFGFFLLPIILTVCILDSLISRNLKKSNSHAQGEYPTWNAVLDGQIKGDIIINGSSRAWVQINPTMIENSLKVPAYNLGIDGHNFWLQNLRYTLFLKYNPKPKLIIHSVDIVTLMKGAELYNPNQFLPYMLWNEDIQKATSVYKGYTYLDYKIPLLRYYGKTDALMSTLKLLFQPQSNQIKRIKGYQGQNKSWNSDFDKAKKEMKFFEAKQDKKLIQLFDNYLKTCQKNNIMVILVYPPEYIEGQKFTKNREKEVIANYKNWSTKYKIPFYDFSNDSLCLDKKYFYNTAHLNKTGAKLYTAKLIDSLKKLERTGKIKLQ